MRDKILQGTSHLSVLRADGLPISDYAKLSEHISGIDGVSNVFLTTYDGALASGPRGSTYAVLRGVDSGASPQNWLQEGSFSPIFSSSNNGQQTSPRAVVGSELAARLGLKVNDVIQIMPASATSSQSTAATHRLRVAGVFRSGLYEYDSTWIYISLDTATALAPGNHSASVLSVKVNNVDEVKRIANEIRRRLGEGYTTVDWQQANQPLFTALALERRMALFTIGLIIAIAVINITTMLTLVVAERKRDIAVLNALGATQNGLMLLFIIEGAVVGACGAICGAALGLTTCLIGTHYKLVSLPADVYSISNVPFNAHAGEILWSALLAFALSILATVYPARAAAKMRPVETFRET
jgi:lipoprotein-releasing system permease protein